MLLSIMCSMTEPSPHHAVEKEARPMQENPDAQAPRQPQLPRSCQKPAGGAQAVSAQRDAKHFLVGHVRWKKVRIEVVAQPKHGRGVTMRRHGIEVDEWHVAVLG